MPISFIFRHTCWLTQVGYRSRGCCSSTQTLWGRLCLVETQRPTTIQRSTSATIQASPWAAGGCASMHLVLLFIQVSSMTIQFEHTQRLFHNHITCFRLFLLQPFLRSWRSGSLCVLCIFSPIWPLVWAQGWPLSPQTCTWCCLSASPTAFSSLLSVHCLTLCSVNTTRARRWEHKPNKPCLCQRTYNGSLLIYSLFQKNIIQMKDYLWTQLKGNVFRAFW